MTDRGNVIKALHCRAQDLLLDLPACDECDYQIQLVNRRGCDYRRICRDALSLLKEQEEKICSVKELAMDEATNATWREDAEAWAVLDRIVQKLS